MTKLPTWVRPGDAATLIWHNGMVEGRDRVRRYQVAGPVFDVAPASPYFLLAPVAREGFATALYRGQIALPDLRDFLNDCVLARGEMVDATEFVATSAETPVLPVLDGWRAVPDRPRLPYLREIEAFIPDELPLYVTAEAYAIAQRAPETFATAWVCDECGEAEDAAVFLWTAYRDESIRVCFLVQNDGGVWSCALHPFEFVRQGEPQPSGEASGYGSRAEGSEAGRAAAVRRGERTWKGASLPGRADHVGRASRSRKARRANMEGGEPAWPRGSCRQGEPQS